MAARCGRCAALLGSYERARLPLICSRDGKRCKHRGHASILPCWQWTPSELQGSSCRIVIATERLRARVESSHALSGPPRRKVDRGPPVRAPQSA